MWFTSSNHWGYPPIPLSVSSRGCRLTYIPLNVTYSYCRFIYCNKHGQTPLRMRIDHIYIYFLQMLRHYNQPQACCYGPHVYYASSTAINKDKRHCACVLMGLQMVGHIYHTTIMLLKSTCILRFIYGKKQGQTPLRMRIDGFCRWWDTYIKPQSCCSSAHVYYASSTAKKTRTNAIAHAY